MASSAGLHIPQDRANMLVDPHAYASRGEIFDTLRWLRENNPVGLAQPEGYNPFWVISRHADVRLVSQQSHSFLNGARWSNIVTSLAEQKLEGVPRPIRSLNLMDAPDHRVYRNLTQTWFTPKSIKQRSEHIRQIARSLLDRSLEDRDELEFVSAVANRYPLTVVMQILGVPAEDEDRMLDLTRRLFGAEENRDARKPDAELTTVDHQTNAINEFFDYFEDMLKARVAHPREDLLTVIAHACINGAPIARLEALSYCVLIATAGHDTTASSIAGGVHALCAFPDELAKVRRNPALYPLLAEEAIRWTTPVQHFARTADEDLELGGRAIRRGDWLMLNYLSANRDGKIFERPDEFRADRVLNPHLSFGYGPHLCLGNSLAKLEIRILFEEFFSRVEAVELTSAPARIPSTAIGGWNSLNLHVKKFQ